MLKNERRSESNVSLTQALELQQKGDLEKAEAAFRAVLEGDKNEPVALYSLGVILFGRGKLDQALELFKRGCEARPDFPYNWFGYGNVLQNTGKREEALRAYDEAIRLKPDYLSAIVNSGVLLRDMYRHKDALMRFAQILEIDPNYSTALANSAILLTEFKESAKAIDMFERLLRQSPDYDYGLGLLLYERLHIGDWKDFTQMRDKIISGIRSGKRICKTLAFMALSDSIADQFECAKIFAKHYCLPPQTPLWKGERYNHKKLRLAYMSPDLREHPVGHLMCGIFENHDKNKFETYAISLGIDDNSSIRARMLKCFDKFIDVRGLTAREIAGKIRELEIDVAVDLAGYTTDSKIEVFSYRPAPVHINFLGYPGTLAVEYIDYIIADRHVIPAEHQKYFSEKVLYMPDTYLPAASNLSISAETPSRESCGLPANGVVFCSFSHDYKINPQLWQVWMSLLKKVPGSVLWLMARNEPTLTNFRKNAEEFGVSPDRIVFARRVPKVEDHLARYRLADVFLDTWPYNAHSTAADALLAGLPVVTYMGNAFPARVAGSLLHAAGLPDLIAHSWEEYENLAIKLVIDRNYLAGKKQLLQANKTKQALFDSERFTRNLENLYLSVGVNFQNQEIKPALSFGNFPGFKIQALNTLQKEIDPELKKVSELVEKRNFALAESKIREYMAKAGADLQKAGEYLAKVAQGYGLSPTFKLSEKSFMKKEKDRYYLIHSLGQTFWQDVHHVAAQCLVAELTGRLPIVHWGENSLYHDYNDLNSFERFFQPLSPGDEKKINPGMSFFPGKWNYTKVFQKPENQWFGRDSRMVAQYLFSRPENAVVSDFFTPLSAVIPWIAQDSSYYGISEDVIYLKLFSKYLKPVKLIQEKAESLFGRFMKGRPWVAVSISGKGAEDFFDSDESSEIHSQYLTFIDRIVQINSEIGIFLISDFPSMNDYYRERYGNRLLTNSDIHTGKTSRTLPDSGLLSAERTLVDALMVSQCNYLIGTKNSYASLAFASQKQWPQGFLFLFGKSNIREQKHLLSI
ncbi:MAG: tetratricopeptide repeat protein [Candidatus Riflebacteria bacterium]|nr:tetratricopeptide repeat protein [Candidatus Riflebacteria bacterium]